MELFRHTLGEGPPLVILHGLFGISDNWMTIGRALSSQFRVIIPDLRNHGRSPHSDAFGYVPMADDLIELFEVLEVKKAVLLGHSMGGKLAMHFAVHYPSLVERLIVVDISPRPTQARQTHFRMMQAMKSVDFDTVTTRADVEEIISKIIKSQPLRLFVLKNLVRTGQDRLSWRLNLRSIEKNIDEIMEGVHAEAPYEGKALFIRGDRSDYITGEDIPAIAALFPNHRLETISNASHWAHADNPEEFLKTVESWNRGNV